jgi:hypothetical protein
VSWRVLLSAISALLGGTTFVQMPKKEAPPDVTIRNKELTSTLPPDQLAVKLNPIEKSFSAVGISEYVSIDRSCCDLSSTVAAFEQYGAFNPKEFRDTINWPPYLHMSQ